MSVIRATLNVIKRVAISFNVYAFYFVRSFWLKDAPSSKEREHGQSLTILLIVNGSWIFFINHQIPFNWKASVFLSAVITF
jgi:hypothetical protein